MKMLLLVLSLGGLLVASSVWAVLLWLGIGEVEISSHGILALALGVLLSLVLGMGLMCLVFYSNRHGHDDDAGR